jgi:hypothetical protein
MSLSGIFMIPTADALYVPIEGMSGVGFKPMNTFDDLGIWSAVIRVEAGQVLPARSNTALCECLVVRGSGRYAGGQVFVTGDYLRETVGDFERIQAQDELVFFVTHHGACHYANADGSTCFVACVDSVEDMQKS